MAELNSEVLSRESRNETTVRIFNEDSSERAKLVIDDKVTRIASQGKTAAVQAGPEVFFIDAAGNIMDRYTSKSDITGVYMARDDLAYVLSSGTISRVKVTARQKFLGIF